MLAGSATAWGFSAAELKCEEGAASAGLKLFKSTLKALQKCEDSISKGKLPATTDCTTETNTAAKITAAENTLSKKLTKICTDTIVNTLATGGGLAGDCATATNISGLNTCLKQSHEGAAIELTDVPYHAPAALTSDQAKCQKTIAGKALTLATKRLGKMQKCKKSIAKGDLAPGMNCVTQTDVGAKLAADTAKSASKVAKNCPTATIKSLVLGAPCTGVGAGGSAGACAFCAYTSAADKLLLTEYGSGPTGSGPAANAMAAQITNPGTQCVSGPLSRCRLNDYIIKNDRIRVVIQDIQRNLFGIGQFGGQIIDADLVRTSGPDRDNFEE